LVGELVSRLLQKSKWRPRTVEDEEAYFAVSYEQWNETLAKKFAAMYKNYKKFQLKYLLVPNTPIDPL
jgi:hypothetical protein